MSESGKPVRQCTLQVRVTQQGADAIDAHRGVWTRSEYVRAAIQAAIARGLRGPEER